MKQLLFLIIVIFVTKEANSQTKTEIDSLNSLTIQDSNISSDSLLVIFNNNLKHSKKLNYINGIADSYWQLSTIFGYRGNQDKAVEYMLKAIKSYENSGNEEKVADSYGELGYKLKREDIEKAQYYMVKGRKLAEEGNFRFIQSRIYNNYGVLKEMQGELDSAELYYKKGLRIVLEDDYKVGIPYSYSNLAGVYGQLGSFDSARYYFEKAKEIRIKNDDPKGVAENFTQIGEVYLEEENASLAIKSFHQAIPLALEENYNFLAQYTYQKLSEAYKLRNNTDSALFYLEKYNIFKDSINSIEVKEKIAELNVEFETERKENEILIQKNKIAENELEIERRNFAISGILALLILGSLLAYLIINRKNLEKKQLSKEKELDVALAKIETQNRLEEQRLRISRDLHDNIGSQLTFIISSLDNLKFKIKQENSVIANKIDEIRVFTTLTINELRDTIWAMNKENISLEELVFRIEELFKNARKLHPEKKFISEFKVNSDKTFTALEGINIFRIIQEALNNAIKYSAAEIITFYGEQRNSEIVFKLQDNGVGYDPNLIKYGNGLYNMEKRAKDIHATIEVHSELNEGVEVVVTK
ncbi:tetratricopeptide repeat-containing sensor histidine kinase [Christiangramia marina]|uniref:tetratricopeptide repeat-containing sensor histidine kinase n=1 Tax=Christiangramia marina TaxID=409436 RepID=UPI003AA9D7EE